MQIPTLNGKRINKTEDNADSPDEKGKSPHLKERCYAV
jgi:hypothetical protein